VDSDASVDNARASRLADCKGIGARCPPTLGQRAHDRAAPTETLRRALPTLPTDPTTILLFL
jgi:hypothetical protein